MLLVWHPAMDEIKFWQLLLPPLPLPIWQLFATMFYCNTSPSHKITTKETLSISKFTFHQVPIHCLNKLISIDKEQVMYWNERSQSNQCCLHPTSMQHAQQQEKVLKYFCLEFWSTIENTIPIYPFKSVQWMLRHVNPLVNQHGLLLLNLYQSNIWDGCSVIVCRDAICLGIFSLLGDTPQVPEAVAWKYCIALEIFPILIYHHILITSF